MLEPTRRYLSVKFEVWSTGTETWSDVSFTELRLAYVHSKTVNNVLHDFFKDELNRWIRCPRFVDGVTQPQILVG